MAAGKTIFASIGGSAAQVIEESGCGKAVPAGDQAGLASLMVEFIDNKDAFAFCGENGRRYFREHFMKDRYMDDIEQFLLDAAKER